MSQTKSVFLSAEWRDLVMLNYEVDSRLLDKFVPSGTELDSFLGKTYVSLVGFRFSRTKLFGYVAIPLHSDFDEINLRFYVRRKEGDEVRRGVVFIAEIVPMRAIATIARLVYGENYVCRPMKHHIIADASEKKIEYQWRVRNKWCRLSAHASGAGVLPEEGSLEQFIPSRFSVTQSDRQQKRLAPFQIPEVFAILTQSRPHGAFRNARRRSEARRFSFLQDLRPRLTTDNPCSAPT